MLPTVCVHGVPMSEKCGGCLWMSGCAGRYIAGPKEKPMNEAGAAYELAVRWTHAKYAVVRALSFWETWVVAASVAYLMARFAPWAAHGFRVVGR